MLTLNLQEHPSLHNIIDHTSFIHVTVLGYTLVSVRDTAQFLSHIASEPCLPTTDMPT